MRRRKEVSGIHDHLGRFTKGIIQPILSLWRYVSDKLSKNREMIGLVLTLLALIVAMIAFEGRDHVFYWWIGGDVISLSPSGYGIIRDVTDSRIIVFNITYLTYHTETWESTFELKKDLPSYQRSYL